MASSIDDASVCVLVELRTKGRTFLLINQKPKTSNPQSSTTTPEPNKRTRFPDSCFSSFFFHFAFALKRYRWPAPSCDLRVVGASIRKMRQTAAVALRLMPAGMLSGRNPFPGTTQHTPLPDQRLATTGWHRGRSIVRRSRTRRLCLSDQWDEGFARWRNTNGHEMGKKFFRFLFFN